MSLAEARSATIDLLLAREAKKKSDAISVCVLGPAAAGKTTFVRQLRANFPADADDELFSPAEVAAAADGIAAAALGGIFALVRGALARGVPLTHDAEAGLVLAAADAPGGLRRAPLTRDLLAAVRTLWRDEPAIERVWGARADLDLPPNAAYFVRRLGAAADAEHFVPSVDDLVRLYRPSRGIARTDARLRSARNEPILLTLFDVGSTGKSGTQSRYHRVSELLGGVRGVVFVASLGDYDVSEPRGAPPGAPLTNRLTTSLALWERLLQNDDYKGALCFCVLSHKDVLVEKLPTSDVKHDGGAGTAARFPDYQGGRSSLAALNYFTAAFRATAERRKRAAHVHVYVLDLTDAGAVYAAACAIGERLHDYAEAQAVTNLLKRSGAGRAGK